MFQQDVSTPQWSAGDVCVDFYWCRCLDRTENLHFKILVQSRVQVQT